MLNLFRSYSPFSVIGLLLLLLVSKLYWLIHPGAPILMSHQQIWSVLLAGLNTFFGGNNWLLTFFAILNLFGQAIYFNRIINEAGFFSERNYLSAFCFIIFSGFLPDWNYLSAPLISNWLILIVLHNLLKLFRSESPIKLIFNAGFATACAALLTSSYLIFIFLFLGALTISRSFKATEWVTLLIGFLTPFYFLIGALYLFGDLNQWTAWLPARLQLKSITETPELKPLILLGFSLILLLIGLIRVNQHTEHMLLQTKKQWGLMVAGIVITPLPLLFEGLEGLPAGSIALFFLSLISAAVWVQNKRQWPPRILFYLFLIVLIFAEWITIPQ